MSDRAAPGSAGPVRRWLGSRKNMAGMAGAVVGLGLHLAGIVGDVWPAVAIGLYGVGALVGPSDPPVDEQRLTDALRADAADLLTRTERRPGTLPRDVVTAVRRILDVVAVVLDRLDQVADQPVDRAAAPERLAAVAEIVRLDLPACLDTFVVTAVSAPDRAMAELVTQLDLVAVAADRLAADVPDVVVRRAEELTQELRRRHGEPPVAS